MVQDEPQSPTDWAAIEAENEELFEWAEDPLAGLDLEDPGNFFWSTSVAIGPGYSDNFLKRELETGSPYLKLESDLFINAFLGESTLLALLYFEGIHYTEDTEVSEEALAFFHLNWSRFSGDWEFGTELDVFYGDQIYDASLSRTAPPESASLRQLRPGIGGFLERGLGEKDSLRLTLDIERALYEFSDDDYWRPRIRLEWQRQWMRSIESNVTVGYFEEHYDDELARERRGFTTPAGEKLLLRGPSLEGSVSWSPDFLDSFKLTGRLGAIFEEDVNGEYDESLRMWASVGAQARLLSIKMSLTGRWQSTDYAYRQVGFFDTRPQHQQYKSLELDLEKELPWNLSLIVRGEIGDFSSRVSEEEFAESRVEALLVWTY